MSETPIFDNIRGEFLKAANAGYSQGRIAERQHIIAVIKKIPRPGRQVEHLLKTLLEGLDK